MILMMKSFIVFSLILFFNFSFGQLNADFSSNNLNVCLGEEVQFNDLSSEGTSPIVAWTWDFGDGISSPLQNATHTYSIPGVYSITLTIQAQDGTSDFEVKPSFITVFALPIADFSLANSACEIPFDAIFSNSSSTGVGVSYSWDFGNGQTSLSEIPIGITYTTVGSYTVSIDVLDANTGCSNSFSSDIEVNDFDSEILLSADTVCIGEAIQIDDASTTGVDIWNWDFGDGTSSTTETNSHLYSAEGTYIVDLTSEDSGTSCQSSTSITVVVLPLPIPMFTVSPTLGCAPLDVTFVNTSSGGVNYTWDFGNGNTFIGQNPPIEQYGNNGSYDVSLTMTDTNGCTNTLIQPSVIQVDALIIDFTADVVDGCDPVDVQFTDMSFSPDPGSDPIVSWQWDFGNGNTFIGEFPPIETYNIGTYDVMLTVTTANGCSLDTILINYIEVGTIDAVDFSIAPIVQCAKSDVEFTNLSVISAPNDPSEITYEWDFGDGGTSTLENPTYNYPIDTGFFDVQLIVDFRGCRDSITQLQAVYILAPISNFIATQTLFCNPESFPLTVDFTDMSIIGAIPDDADMIWSWGDGTFTNFDDPDFDDADLGSTSHDYTTYGTFTIQQLIHNYTTGCEDSTQVTIIISNNTADFTLSNDSVCKNQSITLTDASVSSDPFGTYSYDMGDGSIINGAIQNYTYTTAGSYDIILIATNNVGCADTSTFFGMDVLELPLAVISPSDSLGCAPFDVIFTNNSLPQGNGVSLDSFLWTFPDLTTQTTSSLGATVNYNHITEGIFSTTLVATDIFGCVSPVTSQNITITKPNASFLLDTVVCNLENFIISNTSILSFNQTYEWFIDGTSVSNDIDYSDFFDETPNPPNNVITHLVEMVVTDENGCTDIASANMYVSMPDAGASYTFSGASINANGEYICPPVFADLVDQSTAYGTITNWDWTFGNGNSSIDQNPANTYVFAGTYTSTLTITDEYGCVGDTILTDYITIAGPSASLDWINVGDFCNPMIEFTVDSLSGVTSIAWDLGDGVVSSNIANFIYTYGTNGTFNPVAVISNISGCEVTYNLDPILINENFLNAFFTSSAPSGDIGDEIVFMDASTSVLSPIVSWNWIFSNNTILNGSNADVSNVWSLPGIEVVTLIVSDINGCTDTYSLEIPISAEINVPNVFTPNGDNANDLFTLEFDFFDENGYTIIIVNRWGQLMHEINHHKGTVLWDGIDRAGNTCVEGVYFYKLDGVTLDGAIVNKHGNVTLIRGE